MTDRPLTPADPMEVREALAHALRYDRSGKRTEQHAQIMALAAAEHLVEALRLNNFVVMRGPPLPHHAGALPPHSHLPTKEDR